MFSEKATLEDLKTVLPQSRAHLSIEQMNEEIGRQIEDDDQRAKPDPVFHAFEQALSSLFTLSFPDALQSANGAA